MNKKNARSDENWVAYRKEYRERNWKHILEYRKEYNRTHKEQNKQYAKDYYSRKKEIKLDLDKIDRDKYKNKYENEGKKEMLKNE